MTAKRRQKVQVQLYRPDETGALRFLILRRPPSKGSLWQCVTGNVDPDESLEACARRELNEETALPLSGKDVGEVWRYTFRKDATEFEEAVFGFEAASDDVRLSGEHDAFEWAPAPEAIQRIHYEGIREGLRRVLAALEARDKQ